MDQFHEANDSIIRRGMQRGPHQATVLGYEFEIEPGVFSPLDFEDPEFFAQEIKVEPGQSFLEIGPGHGAIAIIKALQGARPVFAVDINPAAVRTTQRNAWLHDVAHIMTILEGDVYSSLPKDLRFDVIFGNLPYNLVPVGTPLTPYERAFYDPGDTVRQFIGNGPDRLKEGGRLLIAWSPELGDQSFIDELLQVNHFTHRVVAQMRAANPPVTFELLEARLI